MQTLDYTAIKETLERLLSRAPFIENLNSTHVQQAVEVFNELAQINTLTTTSHQGEFIDINKAKVKRKCFKDWAGADSQKDSKLPDLLQFKALLVSADLLRQLLKFRKDGVRTDLIQIYPAIRKGKKEYYEDENKDFYTQILVAIDKQGNPILADMMDQATLDEINEGLQTDSRTTIKAGRDAVDEIRHCPPESCKDLT